MPAKLSYSSVLKNLRNSLIIIFSVSKKFYKKKNKRPTESKKVTQLSLSDTPDNLVDLLSTIFNRSIGQTKELVILCDNDYDKLYNLELNIKRQSIFYCPGDRQEINKILNLK